MKWVKLREHVKLVGGGTPNKSVKEYWNGDIPWASVKDISGRLRIYDTINSITEEGLKKSSTTLVEKGTLIIATRMAVGKPVIAEIDVAINQDLKAAYTSESLNNRYLQYYLLSKSDYFNRIGKGATVKGIKIDDILNLEIPLPTIDRQVHIVKTLDKAQRLIDIDREMLAKYDELIQSEFLEMFGDPITNPKGWEKLSLGAITKIERGGSPRPIKHYLGGTIPWIKISDATRDDDLFINSTKEFIIEEGLTKTRILEPGSLILANSGSVGFARILNLKGCIHDGWLSIIILDNKVLNPIFLLKQINFLTEYLKGIANTGTQLNLNTKIIKDFKVIVPQINIQDEFASIVLKIHSEKTTIRKNMVKAQYLFDSLLKEAFIKKNAASV